MPADTKIPRPRSHRKTRLVWLLSILVLIILVTLFVSLSPFAAREGGFTLGSRVFTLAFDNDPQEKWFVNQSWNSGDFTSGRTLGIRHPWGSIKFQVDHNPVAAIRKKLPTSVPALIKLVESGNPAEVFCAAEALGEKGEGAISALPHLIAAAERNGDIVFAIYTIARAAPTLAVPSLTAALSSTNSDLTSYSAMLLGDTGTNALTAAPALLRTFQNTLLHRPTIAHAIWKITGDCTDTLPVLRQMLHSDAENRSSKASVLRLIEWIGPDAAPAIPDILPLLSADSKLNLQVRAIAALAGIGQEPSLVIPAILSVFETSLPTTNAYPLGSARIEAITALGKFGSAGLPHLIPIYQGTNAFDRITAGRSLATIGPPAAEFLEVFQKELKSDQPRRVALACKIIATLGPAAASAIPRLTELLYSPHTLLQVWAANTLAQLGQANARSIQVLVMAFGSGTRFDVVFAQKSEADQTLTALNQVLATNPEMKLTFERELKANPRASNFVHYLQSRKTTLGK